MAHARPIRATTLQFVLSETAGLDSTEQLLACIAAVVADGHFGVCRDILDFALQQKTPATALREAILHTAPFAGLFRAQQGLRALSQAAKGTGKPKTGFDAIMGGGGGGQVDPATQGDVATESADDDLKRVAEASTVLDAVHGASAGEVEGELDAHSKILGRWLRHDIYGRAFGRPGLETRARVMLSIASLFVMELSAPLAAFVQAGLHVGLTKAQLWHLHDILKRLFKDGHHTELAEEAFAKALGGKRREEFGPGQDPFRWD